MLAYNFIDARILFVDVVSQLDFTIEFVIDGIHYFFVLGLDQLDLRGFFLHGRDSLVEGINNLRDELPETRLNLE